jgi:hypothetical protein
MERIKTERGPSRGCIQLDALQAGTTTIISSAGGSIFPLGSYAFTVWFDPNTSAKPQVLQNFEVSSGDSVNVMVCAGIQSTFGTGMFFNKSTQNSQWVLSTGPSLARETGAWGVMAGGILTDNIFTLYPVPNFTSILFSDCIVGSPSSETDLTYGTLISLSEDDGNGNSVVVAEPIIVGSEGFIVIPTRIIVD